jgi:hypothetical protein
MPLETKSKTVFCEIKKKHLMAGIKGQAPLVEVKSSSSYKGWNKLRGGKRNIENRAKRETPFFLIHDLKNPAEIPIAEPNMLMKKRSKIGNDSFYKMHTGANEPKRRNKTCRIS